MPNQNFSKFLNKGISTPIGILIIVLVAIIAGGGILAWQYLEIPTEEIINTKKGENFFIVLSSNPSTGYQWELEFYSNYIQFIDKEHAPSASGLGGEDTFEFLTLKTGKTKITFSYLRPWLKDKEPPLEKKVFKIKIEQ